MRGRRQQRPNLKQLSARRLPDRPLAALEELEARLVMSAMKPVIVSPDVATVPPPGPGQQPNLPPYTPNAMRSAYGYNRIIFQSGAQYISGNGAGQTIAIVDAFDNPNLATDLANFDAQFALPAANLVKIDQTGVPVTHQVAGDTGWGLEEALDVEWAHALAPAANILLVEAFDNGDGNLYAADQMAASYTGPGIPVRANVVSNSWGGSEYASEAADDHYFTTADNHATFVFSAGDDGAPPIYPSASPNVLSVGGTKLTMTLGGMNTFYGSETGWSLGSDNVPPYNNPNIASGGGPSAFESEPSYQTSYGLNLGARGTPDVGLQADPLTGVYVLDTYGGGSPSGWWRVGGTSFSAPAWAALLTDANQGRALNNLAPLGAGAQADLYAMQKSTGYYSAGNTAGTFRDITTGYNGYNAGPGYDYITGVGTPVANTLAIDLATTAFGPNGIVKSPGSGGAGGGGLKLGGNVIADALPINNALLMTAFASSANANVLPPQMTSGRVDAGNALTPPMTLAAGSPSLSSAVETYRAYAAPLAAENAAAPGSSDVTGVSSVPAMPEMTIESLPVSPSMDSGTSEWAPSGWAHQEIAVEPNAAVIGEESADLAMAAAMALTVSGSWNALDPQDADKKHHLRA